MDKKTKFYSALLVLCLASILYAEYTKPKAISWFPSFVASHTAPYGTYILKKELPSLFPNTRISEINTPPYEYLADSTVNGTYMFIDGQINMGTSELSRLMRFVSRGNDVFMAAQDFDIDTLHLETKALYANTFIENTLLTLQNAALSKDSLYFMKQQNHIVFSKLDTLKTTVLGYLSIVSSDSIGELKEVNYIKYSYGKGSFYLHTFPYAFTNYAILEGQNHTYVSSALSYIDPSKLILWDSYYKTGKSSISSPLHYILSSKNLKYAYYTVLLAVGLFIVFKGKRDQRAIPVISPLVNQSEAFTRTVAMMFLEEKAHQEIAMHKIKFFLEHVRSAYQLQTHTIDATFIAQLAMRSGNDEKRIKQLFAKIEFIQSQQEISQEVLIELNTLIEQFKQHTL